MSFRKLSELEAFFIFRREWKARDFPATLVVLAASVLDATVAEKMQLDIF
jgi:hypothetical protein